VEVINNSESHHLDPNALASWMAIQINAQGSRAGVTGLLAKNPCKADEDAVLQVTVLSETLAPGSGPSRLNGGEQWSSTQSLGSAHEDGWPGGVARIGWGLSIFRSDAQEPDAADLWKEPGLQNWLTVEGRWRLVARMLNAR
jgi:hypothetical protein